MFVAQNIVMTWRIFFLLLPASTDILMSIILRLRKGSLFSDSRPVLFFAELDNEEDDGAPLFCCQVDEPAPFSGMNTPIFALYAR